jgi:hypothetical protein
MHRQAQVELAAAIAQRGRVLCEDCGSIKMLTPRMDKDGLEYVRVGRVPGVRYEITGARKTVGDQYVFLLQHIPAAE